MSIKGESIHENLSRTDKTNIHTAWERLLAKEGLTPEKIQKGIPVDLAEDALQHLFEKGERPLVTVPMHHLEETVKSGLSKHLSWLGDMSGKPRFDNVVGTMGVPPYRESDRAVFKVNIKKLNDILPRFTGKDHAFHGVVVFKRNIDLTPDMFELVQDVNGNRPN